MITAAPRPGDGQETTWEVRRGGEAIGRVLTGLRRSQPVVREVDVATSDAPAALAAVMGALAATGATSVAVDVRTGDETTAAALAGQETSLATTQMSLDLSRPVEPPRRVVLEPMTEQEFAAYREHLVTAYAQDLFDVGTYDELSEALAASETSTRELLPDGLTTSGEHLWTPRDGQTPVGILWIHVDGSEGFIYDIEVAEDQRRRGYGREVLDAGAIAARELGAERLGLNVFGPNTVAHRMYEQAGYETTDRTYRIRL